MGVVEKKLSKKEQKAQEFKRRKKGLISEEEVESEKKRKFEKKEAEAEEKRKKIQEQKQKKKNRFILFVGNLSYKITEHIVKEHFKPASPSLIRLRKGYAFIEFEGNDASKRMNIALRLHHTLLQNRKINVELTAGGGGNNENRKNKLRERNNQLRQEQSKRVDKEQKEQKNKKKSAASTEDEQSVHPSRLGLIED